MKIYNKLFLFFIFIIPFFPMPKSTLGFLSPAIIVIIVVSGIGFGLYDNIKINLNSNTSKLLLLLIISIFWEMIVGLFHSEPRWYRYPLAKVSMLLILLSLIIYYSEQKGKKEDILKILAISAGVISVLLILGSIGVTDYGRVSGAGRTFFGVQIPFRKATGVPLSDGKVGILLVPTFFIMKEFGRSEKKFKFLAFIILIAIILGQSRSTYLAFIFSYMFYNINKKGYKLSKIVFAVVTIFVILNIQTIVSGFVSTGIYRENVVNRFDSFEKTFNDFGKYPIFGKGHEENTIKHKGKEMVIHNHFIDQLGATGLPGFLILLAIFSLAFRVAFRKRNLTQQSYLDIILLIPLVVELFLYRGLYNEYTYLYIGLIMVWRK